MEKMTCPDPTALDRTDRPDADPAVLEHLKTCPSCWLNWQIQHGLRHVLDPQIEVRADLNERVIARVALRAAQLEKTLRWRDLAMCAALVTAATMVFFLAATDAAGPVSFGLNGALRDRGRHRGRAVCETRGPKRARGSSCRRRVTRVTPLDWALTRLLYTM